MKSIRLVLMFYLLALLAVALGAGSVLVYGITQRSLRDKERTTRELLKAQYRERAQAVEEEFDNRILRRAQTLASLAQSQWRGHRFVELHGIGTISACATGTVNAYAALPLCAAETVPTSRGAPSRLFFSLYGQLFTTIQFADEVLSQDSAGGNTEYFQIYNDAGTSLQRSRSMENAAFVLDPALRESLEPLEWRFDDAELRPGVRVRRVTLKVPVFHFRRFDMPRFPRQERRAERRPAPPPDPPVRPAEPRVRSSPFAFIQCAYTTAQREAELGLLAAKEQQEETSLENESSQQLATLRRDLVCIAVATLAASLLGGFFLVRFGLSPLRRLSEAVSRVSEKNFRLPLEEAAVPVELRPVVGRLQRALELLRRAFSREKQAAADISHELRTPVAALLTSVEVALRRPRSPEEYREVLAECRGGAQQISHLVERLLALARLDAGADHLRTQSVNATALAQQCAAMVRPLAEARGLRLSVHTSSPVHLSADPDKLREVVTNLLHNAIQYNRPNGSVDLTVERENGHLRLEVQDTGVGITPEAREHIFERFFRADAARQSDGVHAGLGLAIVKGYVELMGGSIAVESTPDKGSKFSVELPIQSRIGRN